MKVAIDLIALTDSGEHRHALEVVAAFGLKYRHAEPQPIADQWMLLDVDPASMPDHIPPFLRIVR